jgi:hypothetical protein
MPSQRRHGGLIILSMLLSCSWAWATDPNRTTLDMPPGGSAADPNAPAFIATPADTGATSTSPASGSTNGPSTPLDASNYKKFYTITAELRETYDDNAGTTDGSGEQGAQLETSFTPSILINYPMTDGLLTGRYSFGITYYSKGDGSDNSGGSNQGSNQGSIELTHELIAQYTHAFSDRFNLALAEQFRYFTDPSLYESTGSVFNDGPYISNAINANLAAQWTPLFSTTTTFADTVVKYENALAAATQDSVENTGSQSFNYAILPKITASVGFILDNISYQSQDRGYTNSTLFMGAEYSISPSLSVNVRGGGSYTVPASGQALIAPYAAASLSWTLGERSTLSLSYSHEVTPNDEEGTNGQESDRFNAGFSYVITPSLSADLQGIFSDNVTAGGLAGTGNGASSYDEQDYSLDIGGSYQYDKYLGLDFGYSISGVTSGIGDRDYVRNEIYVGVRGTY